MNTKGAAHLAILARIHTQVPQVNGLAKPSGRMAVSTV